MDVYKEIRRLQLEGVTSQRGAAKRLGISRNTVKKYWEGANVPWDHISQRTKSDNCTRHSDITARGLTIA